MVQYSSGNVKLSNSELDKWTSRINNGTELTLDFSHQMWFSILMMRLSFDKNHY